MGRLAAACGIVAGALTLALALPIQGQGAALLNVSISGKREVGQTLRADPNPWRNNYRYEWRRCRSRERSSCDRRIGGNNRTLRLGSSERGFWISAIVTEPIAPPTPTPTASPTPTPTVTPDPTPDPSATPDPTPDDGDDQARAAAAVSVWSDPAGPVTARTGAATPTPTPSPTPQSPAPPAAPGPAFTLQGALPALPLAPRFLKPFPVVRVRGTVAKRGAHVSLLRVTGPRRATVKLRCKGADCPIKRRARRPGRIRALERFLPAGVEITIRVRRQALVGKYVRLRIRAGKPPARRDACVMPGDTRPVPCPPS